MTKPDPSLALASQLMAVEVISELLVSTSPQEIGAALTEHLRELSGAKTVMVLVHGTESTLDEILNVSPMRRANLFSVAELSYFCFERYPEKIPYLPEELPIDHPLREPLLTAGITSLARYALQAGGTLVGTLLLFDLPDIERIAETNQIIHLLTPPIALALKNALAYRLIEQQSKILEQRVQERTSELKEAQTLLQVAIDNSPIPIMIHDEDDNILQLSSGWINISGYNLSDIPTLSDWTEHAYGNRAGVAKTYIDNLISINESVNNGEWQVITKDGSTRIWDFQTTPLGRLSKGKRALLTIAVDITDRKQAETDRIILEQKLQQAQKMEAIGDLAGGIAHDFNNILSAILGYAEIAKEDTPADSPIVEDLEQVIISGNRAKDLVKQILTFSRQAKTERIRLRPATIIKEAIKLLRSSIPATITIKQDLAPNTAPILADPTQIHQILMNLCTNSFHSMEETGGTITISLSNTRVTEEEPTAVPNIPTGDYILLSVEDNGPGIPPEIIEKIFDPYFTTKGVGKGTGLGLSIIHGIIKSYEGFISCESQLGQGSSFQVFIPAVQEECIPTLSYQVDNAPPGGTEHILFVDDEEILTDLGQKTLENLGYKVTISASSQEAFNIFADRVDDFDLVITDQTMPGMTGLDLAEKILQLKPHLPIIICTGYSNTISKQKVNALGIKSIAMKPLTKGDIATLVRQALESQ